MKQKFIFIITGILFVLLLISCDMSSIGDTKSKELNSDNPNALIGGTKKVTKITKVALQSISNNKYLCADLNYGPDAPLYVNRDAIGPWEKFYLIQFQPEDSDGYDALLSVATGKYVCAENDGTSRAVANRDTIQEWETLSISIDVNKYGTYCSIYYPRNWKYFSYGTMIPDNKNASWFKVIVIP